MRYVYWNSQYIKPNIAESGLLSSLDLLRLADKDTSWSDNCAMASSFTLSRCLSDWFNSSNSSILVCMSARPVFLIDGYLEMSGRVFYFMEYFGFFRILFAPIHRRGTSYKILWLISRTKIRNGHFTNLLNEWSVICLRRSSPSSIASYQACKCRANGYCLLGRALNIMK